MRRVFAYCRFHDHLQRTKIDFVILEKYFLKGGGNLAPTVYRLILQKMKGRETVCGFAFRNTSDYITKK